MTYPDAPTQNNASRAAEWMKFLLTGNRVWHVASTLLADYPQADAMVVQAASLAAKKFAADYPLRARRQYGE